jgi:hydrogenase maturation protease
MTRTCVVGVGQAAAGDDGVGLAVLDELGRRCIPEGTALIRLPDPLDLVELLGSEQSVVLVDAVLGVPAGRVVEIDPEQLSNRAAQPASSHGLGAARAIELARALSPACAALRIVAVTIARPEHYGTGLAPEVAAAVRVAADHVVTLLGGKHA